MSAPLAVTKCTRPNSTRFLIEACLGREPCHALARSALLLPGPLARGRRARARTRIRRRRDMRRRREGTRRARPGPPHPDGFQIKVWILLGAAFDDWGGRLGRGSLGFRFGLGLGLGTRAGSGSGPGWRLKAGSRRRPHCRGRAGVDIGVGDGAGGGRRHL